MVAHVEHPNPFTGVCFYKYAATVCDEVTSNVAVNFRTIAIQQRYSDLAGDA